MIYENIIDLLGNTPVVKYDGIYIKLECYNPTGSIKDRAAYYMIDGAMKKGLLKKNDTIVEPTSGNTGIGLAAFGKVLGFNVVIIMPDTMSIERIKAIKAYGAEVILTDGKFGMKGSVDLANKLVEEKGYVLLDQFKNPDNAYAHEMTTAKEIIQDFDELDYLVCGIGTGGTITGLSRVLKEHYPNLKVIGVEPEKSPLLTKGYSGGHGLQGIGANFIPEVLDLKCVDEIVTVGDEEAYTEMDRLAKNGLFLGISSAAAVFVAKRFKGKVLAISPDGGLKYLSIIK